MTRAWQPDVVVTDFEPLSATYARVARAPLIAVDNINMLDRCRHDAEILDGHRDDFAIARAVTRSMVPNAVRYIVTTFFYPPLAKNQTTLVPPILRQRDRRRRAEPGEHLVVYSSGEENAMAALRASGVPCRVYGMRGGPAEGTIDGNLEFKPRSNEGFVEDLRTARGVVAGGGFSLMSEAVYLGKPMLAMPLFGQFEQTMNSRYLEREGYGVAATELTEEVLERFLGGLDGYRDRLAGYEQDGNDVDAADDRGADRGRRRPSKPADLRRARRRSRTPPVGRQRDTGERRWSELMNKKGNRSGGGPRRCGSRRGRLLRRPGPDRADLRADDPPQSRRGRARSRSPTTTAPTPSTRRS